MRQHPHNESANEEDPPSLAIVLPPLDGKSTAKYGNKREAQNYGIYRYCHGHILLRWSLGVKYSLSATTTWWSARNHAVYEYGTCLLFALFVFFLVIILCHVVSLLLGEKF